MWKKERRGEKASVLRVTRGASSSFKGEEGGRGMPQWAFSAVGHLPLAHLVDSLRAGAAIYERAAHCLVALGGCDVERCVENLRNRAEEGRGGKRKYKEKGMLSQHAKKALLYR